MLKYFIKINLFTLNSFLIFYALIGKLLFYCYNIITWYFNEK